MATITQKATVGQNKQIIRFGSDQIEAVLAKLNLDKESMQLVIEHGDEFATDICEATIASLKRLSVPNQFANEEVKSNYDYLSGYKPAGIVAQINRLHQLFSGIGFANQNLLTQIENGKLELPNGAEGWFAIPNWVKNPKIFGKTYAEAVQKVLDEIKRSRMFYNYREGSIDDEHLRQSARLTEAWKKISEAQGNSDILIISAQFGKRHAGRSIRRACVAMNQQEFGLGAFAVGIMLLTHPKRLMHNDELYINCAGDGFDFDGDDKFSSTLFFRFSDGGVEFGTLDVVIARGYFGTSSGFFS